MLPLRLISYLACGAAALTICATSLKAQLEILGTDELIGAAVASSFPESVFRDQVIGQLTQAIGNNGDAIATGVNSSTGLLIGNGVAGATTASANVNIGTAVSTNITWTTSISWAAYTNSSGYVHFQVTVTWGNSSASYTRQIDVPTSMPNSAAAGAGNPIPSVNTSGTTTWFNNGSGRWELQSYPATHQYMDNGVWRVIGYTAWVWVWVPDRDGNPGNQNVE